MTAKESLTRVERIERLILVIRGQRIMLDADLARLYGVSTKRLNEQVKRNKERFPERFMFRLTAKEKAEVVANCDHLQKLKFSPVLPHAFTEHGAIMAATVLNTCLRHGHGHESPPSQPTLPSPHGGERVRGRPSYQCQNELGPRLKRGGLGVYSLRIACDSDLLA
jgi:hypothetical protein